MNTQVCSDCAMLEYRKIDSLTPGILEDIRELYIEAGWLTPESDSTFLAPALLNSAAAVCCLENGRVVGCGRALSDGCSDAYIQDVVVASSARRRGIGGEIIRQLVREVRRSGCDWIALVGEPGTEKFYRELGLEMKKDYTMWQIPEFFAKKQEKY